MHNTAQPTMVSQTKTYILSTTLILIFMFNTNMALEICKMDAAKLSDCLPAIRGSNPTPPTAACCATIGTADLQCLCGFKDSFLLRSVGVDPKLAVALPSKCNLSTPPQCKTA